MSFPAALTNHLTTNPNTYIMLKKIYTLHVKYNNRLFINLLTPYSLNILNSNPFLKKTTKTLPKTSRKSQRKTIKHQFFLTTTPNIFSQNQSLIQTLATSKSKSLQHRSWRRVSGLQNRRTRLLLTHLLITTNKVNPYSLTTGFNTNLGLLRRYKLLQTTPQPQPHPTKFLGLVDSRKVFNFFLSLLKLYKRGPRKQNLLFQRKPLKVTQPVISKLKNTSTPLTNNTWNFPIKALRITPRKPFAKVASTRIKSKKNPNLFYHWISDHLNTSKTLQSFTQPLILLKQPLRAAPRPEKTYYVNKGLVNQQSYPLTSLKHLLTPLRLTRDGVFQSSQNSNKSRFLVGTETAFLTPLMSPSTTLNPSLHTQEQVNTQVQKFSFATTLTTKKFLSILVSQTKLLSSRNTWENLVSTPNNKKITSNYTSGRPGKLASWSCYQNDDLYINTRLTHIRFKPGYSRQWRVFRNEFREVFNLSNRYQYRLTRYLASLSTTQQLHQKKNQTFLLKHGLVESKLAPNLETAVQYIVKGLTFLNGSLSSNPNLCLTQHDFVQLVVSLKYYTIVKWQAAQTLKNKAILAKLLWKRGKNWRRNKFTFPNWVLNFSTTFLDTPLYLEADHFSLSFYVLTANYAKPEGAQLYPKVLSLYNWKYII